MQCWQVCCSVALRLARVICDTYHGGRRRRLQLAALCCGHVGGKTVRHEQLLAHTYLLAAYRALMMPFMCWMQQVWAEAGGLP